VDAVARRLETTVVAALSEMWTPSTATAAAAAAAAA